MRLFIGTKMKLNQGIYGSIVYSESEDTICIKVASDVYKFPHEWPTERFKTVNLYHIE